MKKTINFLALAIIVLLSACGEDDVAKKYTLSFKVTFPSDVTVPNETEISAKAQNKQSGKVYEVTFIGSESSIEVESGEYSIITKTIIDMKPYQGNSSVIVNENKLVTIEMSQMGESALILKEIYYMMTPLAEDNTSPYFDQFYELYNNSDQVVYLDNVIFGILSGFSVTPSPWVDENGVLLNRYPTYNYVFAFPGSGKEHSLMPGKSVVIAQSALNHKSLNAGTSVDLSNADWETYVGDVNSGQDVDASNVPNLKLLYAPSTGSKDFMVFATGSATFIARLPEGTDLNTWITDPNNLMMNPGYPKVNSIMIPREYILDAVDIVDNTPSSQNKRFHPTEDAGVVFCNGVYTGKSIRRKVKETVNGRIIYQDTNNSSDDFLNDQDPTPGVIK